MFKAVFLLFAVLTSSRSFGLANGDYKVDNQGVKIWIRVSGQGPVCLVVTPGWGPSVDMYMSSMKTLEANHTMVYMDDRGSGRSDRPQDSSEYAMTKFTSDIEAVRNFVGAGPIFLELWLNRDDLVNSVTATRLRPNGIKV